MAQATHAAFNAPVDDADIDEMPAGARIFTGGGAPDIRISIHRDLADAERAKIPKKLPVVLSATEVALFFQAIGILFGAMISLGSGSSVANAVSGVVLTYMRPFQVGDFVRIADAHDVMSGRVPVSPS